MHYDLMSEKKKRFQTQYYQDCNVPLVERVFIKNNPQSNFTRTEITIPLVVRTTLDILLDWPSAVKSNQNHLILLE